jgi:aryl-alcohol dehydrogenase-like predicted oxidoreductase
MPVFELTGPTPATYWRPGRRDLGMQSVLIDQTQLRVSRWSFGTASLHHLPRSIERQRLLRAAVNAGFTHFDTSPFYGYGLAERELSGLIKHGRAELTLATKVGLYPPGHASHRPLGIWYRKVVGRVVRRVSAPRVDWSVAEARKSLAQSLRRLGTDYVDLLYLHEPDATLIPADQFLRWLEDEQVKGRIRYWGLAGLAPPMTDLVRGGSRLAHVLQVKDSVGGHEANALVKAGRKLQFTYGYLSDLRKSSLAVEWFDYARSILARNPYGSVIISTRRTERIAKFVDGSIAG